MSKHSPAPWTVYVPKSDQFHLGIDDASGNAVVMIDGGVQEKADALLIAAAPELLDALKLLVIDVQDYEPWQRPCHALDMARAAIAKATGAQP